MSVQSVVDEIQSQIGGFSPQGRDQVDEFFKGLPDLFRELGKSIGQAADACADEPGINPDVVDAVRELGSTAGGVADSAEQTMSEHLTKHSIWLE